MKKRAAESVTGSKLDAGIYKKDPRAPWGSRLVNGGDYSTDATVFLTHNTSDRWNVVLYALKGFDSGSPDYGFDGQITYKF